MEYVPLLGRSYLLAIHIYHTFNVGPVTTESSALEHRVIPIRPPLFLREGKRRLEGVLYLNSTQDGLE
jgi:hypothetical protein